MNIQTMAKLPLTWLDVERSFRRTTSNFTKFETNITDIRCFPDGAELEFNGIESSISNIQKWLFSVFDRALVPDGSAVTLQIGTQLYPIEFIHSEKVGGNTARQYPLWRDQVYLNTDAANYPEAWASAPKIVSFHSFKGGVGRTTSLMTYASAMLDVVRDKPVRLLLIDADLEAPGISFWLDPSNRPTVSFLNLLEALHYPPSDAETSLEYFAAELRKTSLNVGGTNREIFVLPAALDISEIMDMPVRPEHIARNPKNPWQLSDYLHVLGVKLQVDVIFVDLRAGLSELSSPLLFDPRVEHFFVTTVAPQSMLGMAEVLNRLHTFQQSLSEDRRSMATPSLILGLLTDQLRQLPDYTQAIQTLNEAYPADCDDAVSSGLEWIESGFDSSLMSLNSVRHALEILRRSSLYPIAKMWAETRNRITNATQAESVERDLHANEANQLYTLCNSFQFAEQATPGDMLVTEPLRNLAKHYSDALPNTVSVGAKGAGKTFTYLQICRLKNWAGFLQALGSGHPSIQGGVIYPLMWSTNVEGESLNLIQKTRKAAIENLRLEEEEKNSNSSLSSKITMALRDSETDWNVFWEKALIGEFYDTTPTLASLNSRFIEYGRSVVLVIDGIEDIFDAPEDENQRRAIKSLLQLPNQLNELEHRNIGLVCFVRADYVQIAIRQNMSQYLARFQPFRLEWSAETFLRLVYWISGQAGIVGASSQKAEQLTTDELLKNLEKLWGKKMGRDDAKEAMTARWVFAALCDLNGRLQARDIVRFLKFAAKRMSALSSEAWKDRILVPEAIRKSLQDCSDEKVKEAISEIAALRKWKEMLDTLPQEMLKTPFSAESLSLSSELLGSLRELGVVYEDTDRLDDAERFYLPEIYRSGLGFRSAVSGRPRVQALLKRNLGGMPF